MTTTLIRLATTTALVLAQIAPALAQPAPPTAPSRGGPQVVPAGPDVPQIQPPRPSPGGPQIQPPRPSPGGPQIQPPRPVGPVPVQPPVRPLPPTPPVIERPQILPPVYPGRNFAGFVRCESFNSRGRRCNANTGNRVEVVRTLSGSCRRDRNWGFTRSYVWVERGCGADFGYGYARTGNPYPVPQPQPVRDRGPSAGAVVAGVVVAGGLVALLASRKKAGTPATSAPTTPETFPAGPPATLSVDLSSLPSAARSSVQNCMFDAARQIGVTGGTMLRFERTISLDPGNGGWRIRAAVTASYPDGDRSLDMYCRATPTKIVQLDFS